MNYMNLLIGACCFLMIGVCHPLVIRLEYYCGKQSWIYFFMLAVVLLVVSLYCTSDVVSVIVGTLSFALFWSSHEVIVQHKRVLQGRFPKNPKREYEY